jgi:MoaA/NifB/PqqE/SkfB family radical SAM enzyme
LQSAQKSPAAGQKEKGGSALLFPTRVLGILWRHARTVRSLVREELQRKWNNSWAWRRRRDWSGPPLSLSLDLTRRCNLKCRMCEQHRHTSGPPPGLSWYDPAREIPLAAWTGLLDQVASFRPRPRIFISGGEPTLHRDFPGLIREAKIRGFLVQLQTNGTRLAELADFLVAQEVEMINVSIDGPPEIHDATRGREGIFRQIAGGIKALRDAQQRQGKSGPLLSVNCVISKANVASLDRMAPLVLELGADALTLIHTVFNAADNVARHNLLLAPEWAQSRGLELAPPSIPEGEYYESEIAPEDLPILRQNLERLRKEARGRLLFSIQPNLPLDQLESYYLDLSYPSSQVCNALWNSCRILADGTVSPCLHVVAGRITEEPFQEIWNGPRMRNFRKIINRRLFPGCARCCNRGFA